MANDFVAQATTTIQASAAEVWDALVDPAKIKEYMFGTNVSSEWKVGGPITWKGEWEGKPYEDKGEILQLTPQRVLQYTHFSPMTGLPDKPENYHTVTIELADNGTATNVTLTQDNNADEKDREHSEKNWSMMLDGLKTFVEKQR
jgi:uncharacterized protein YndB with AHSA1/START domain